MGISSHAIAECTIHCKRNAAPQIHNIQPMFIYRVKQNEARAAPF
jgi:hypothetical protein